MDIVTLLELLVKGLNEAEEKFFENSKDFYSLETSVRSTTESFAAGYLGMVMSSINGQIYRDGRRKGKFKVQRNDERTIITSVGDVTFENTYYENCKNKGEYHYLTEEIMGITAHERFSEAAEVAMLAEALKTSYGEVAKVLPSKSKITKTTVMNKVHSIAEEIPEEKPEERKKVSVLFIEADEDHVAQQHGRWSDKSGNVGFISKLAYVYEESIGVEKFWNKVGNYIYDNYDEDSVEKIYISGDGAGWIKSSVNYIPRSLFCIDKYHLTKYINRASNQMSDEAETANSEIYRLLYKRRKKELGRYIEKMEAGADNQAPVADLKTFVMNNWNAIMRTLHDRTLDGCSTESHVSHVLSDRLSSRPKAWSKTGADRMSKLRCYERNHGREKIIDLVKYSREKRQLARTGTDGITVENITLREVLREHRDKSKSNIDSIQATMPGITSRKIFSIREQLKLI